MIDAVMEKIREAQLQAASKAGLPRKRYLAKHPEEVQRLIERANQMMHTEAVRSL